MTVEQPILKYYSDQSQHSAMNQSVSRQLPVTCTKRGKNRSYKELLVLVLVEKRARADFKANRVITLNTHLKTALHL